MVTEIKSEKIVKDLKASLKAGTVLLGTEKVLKELKAGNIKIVYCSSSVPEDVLVDIEKAAQLTSSEAFVLDIPNDELGVVCQKPFSVSVLGFKK